MTEVADTFSLSAHRGTVTVDVGEPEVLDPLVLVAGALHVSPDCGRIVIRRQGKRYAELRLIGQRWHRIDRSVRHRPPKPIRGVV